MKEMYNRISRKNDVIMALKEFLQDMQDTTEPAEIIRAALQLQTDLKDINNLYRVINSANEAESHFSKRLKHETTLFVERANQKKGDVEYVVNLAFEYIEKFEEYLYAFNELPRKRQSNISLFDFYKRYKNSKTRLETLEFYFAILFDFEELRPAQPNLTLREELKRLKEQRLEENNQHFFKLLEQDEVLRTAYESVNK